MMLIIPIEKSERTVLRLERNWFLGSFTYSLNNGPSQTLRSSLDITTHFDLKNTRHYTIELQDSDTTTITIKHFWPALFAGLRPHNYEVYIDGNLIKNYKGY